MVFALNLRRSRGIELIALFVMGEINAIMPDCMIFVESVTVNGTYFWWKLLSKNFCFS